MKQNLDYKNLLRIRIDRFIYFIIDFTYLLVGTSGNSDSESAFSYLKGLFDFAKSFDEVWGNLIFAGFS